MKDNIKITLENDVYDEVFALMTNINKINKGHEIGAWLLGEWTKHDGGTHELVLDKFVIPKQEVSKTEVDISQESMIDTIKELGSQECNRIKAHWHIHPFGKGDTNWSSIDDTKINDFTDPQKGREIFVFLLSSEDKIKARVEINAKVSSPLSDETDTIKLSYDNLEVHRKDEPDMSPIIERLKQRIDEKVSEIKSSFKSSIYPIKTSYNTDHTYAGKTTSNTIVSKPVYDKGYFNEYFGITVDKKKITVNIDNHFNDYIEKNGWLDEYHHVLDEVEQDGEEILYYYKVSKSQKNEIATKLEVLLSTAQYEYDKIVAEQEFLYEDMM